MRPVRSATIVAVSLLAVASLAACGDPEAPVDITYDQEIAFASYKPSADSNASIAGDGGIFIMYRVTRMDNTGPNAKPYTFDSSKVAVDTGQDFSQEHAGSEAQMLGTRFLSKKSLKAGESLVSTGNPSIGCFIIFAKHSNPKSLVGKLLPLVYSPSVSADNNVHMIRDSADKSVATVIGTVSPTTLAKRCDGGKAV